MTAEEWAGRFLAKIQEAPSGCWIWQGAIHKKTGYGAFSIGYKSLLAHRASYVLHVGPIPDGLQLDHLCRTRRCVRPLHLQPVSARLNTLRGLTLPAANAARTACPQGHPYEGTNLLVKRGHRLCRACWNTAQRRWGADLRARRRAS